MAKKDITSLPKKYIQVRDSILAELDKNKNKEIRLLPERELSEFYGVSRLTIRRSLKELLNAGSLIRDKVNGVCVRPPVLTDKNRIKEKPKILTSFHQLSTGNIYIGRLLAGSDQVLRYCKDDYTPILAPHMEVSFTGESVDLSQVTGIITLNAQLDFKTLLKKNKNLSFAYAFHNYKNFPENKVDRIDIDNVWCVKNAVQYLLTLGHRDIGCVTGAMARRENKHPADERLEGFLTAMKEAGISVNEKFIREGRWTTDTGYAEGVKLFKMSKKPTAVFVSNDEMAIGVIRAAVEAGLNVPEDVSVIGFDDIDHVSKMNPPLTTVASCLKEIGDQAARLLLERLRNPELENREILIRGPLVIRDSCAPPKIR